MVLGASRRELSVLWHGGHPEPVASESSEEGADIELEEMGVAPPQPVVMDEEVLVEVMDEEVLVEEE